MTGLALVLLGVSLADLVAGGISGKPEPGWRLWAGLGVGWLVPGLLAFQLGGEGLLWLGWTALVAVTSAGWMLPRAVDTLTATRAHLAVAVLVAGAVAAVLLSGAWPDRAPDGWQSWMGDLAYPWLATLSPARLFLGVGLVLFLTAPANGFVRAVLAMAGTEITDGEQRLRGGRFIGVIERYLIFGLAVAGEPTAAALVVSAKSILRFPELSSKSRSPTTAPVAEVDVVTEYFLLGSLVSWLLALAPVALLR